MKREIHLLAVLFSATRMTGHPGNAFSCVARQILLYLSARLETVVFLGYRVSRRCTRTIPGVRRTPLGQGQKPRRTPQPVPRAGLEICHRGLGTVTPWCEAGNGRTPTLFFNRFVTESR
jgi:hypothetical protein